MMIKKSMGGLSLLKEQLVRGGLTCHICGVMEMPPLISSTRFPVHESKLASASVKEREASFQAAALEPPKGVPDDEIVDIQGSLLMLLGSDMDTSACTV